MDQFMDNAPKQSVSEQVQSDQCITKRDISGFSNAIEVITDVHSITLPSTKVTTPILLQFPQQFENLEVDGAKRDNEHNEDTIPKMMEQSESEFSGLTVEFAQVSIGPKFSRDTKSTERAESVQIDSDGEQDDRTEGTRDLTALSKHPYIDAVNSVLESHSLDLSFNESNNRYELLEENGPKQFVSTENQPRLKKSRPRRIVKEPGSTKCRPRRIISKPGQTKCRPRRIISKPEPTKSRPRRIINEHGPTIRRPGANKSRHQANKSQRGQTECRRGQTECRRGPIELRGVNKSQPEPTKCRSRPIKRRDGLSKSQPRPNKRRPEPIKIAHGLTSTPLPISIDHLQESVASFSSQLVPSSSQHGSYSNQLIRPESFTTVGQTGCLPKSINTPTELTDGPPRPTKTRYRRCNGRRAQLSRSGPKNSLPDSSKNKPHSSCNQPGTSSCQPGPSNCQPGPSSCQPGPSSCQPGPSSSHTSMLSESHESDLDISTDGESTASPENLIRPIPDIVSICNVVSHLCVEEDKTIIYHLRQMLESSKKTNQYLEVVAKTKYFVGESIVRFLDLALEKRIPIHLLTTFNKCVRKLNKVGILLERITHEAIRHYNTCGEIIKPIIQIGSNYPIESIFSVSAPPELFFMKETARSYLRALEEPLEAMHRAMRIAKLRYDIYKRIKRLVSSFIDGK